MEEGKGNQEILKLKEPIKSYKGEENEAEIKKVKTIYSFTIGHLPASAACVMINSDSRTKTTSLMCLTS